MSEGTFVVGVALTASEAALAPRNEPQAASDTKGEDSASVAEGSNAGGPTGSALPLSASPLGNYYVYSFDGKLLQVYDVYGTLLKDYIYMGERMIAEYDHVGSRLLYYTPDQINSTRVVTDQAGNVIYWAVHDPYGGIQLAGQNNTYDPQLKFSGKEHDIESEFDYFGARYYDRSQYRFISVDPIRPQLKLTYDSAGMNLYSYCADNPLSAFDPDGRELIRVNLPGITGDGTTTNLHSWLDSDFASRVGDFVECCTTLGVDVRITSAFRSRAHQKDVNAKVKHSLHSAGWAIDINWGGLSDDSRGLVLIAAYLSGLKSGMSFSSDPTSGDFDPVHFYAEPTGDRAALIENAAQTISNYANFGIAGLTSAELFILYGVFTEQAAWIVLANAERDLTGNKK